MKYLMLLVYLFGTEPKMEHQEFKTLELCQKSAQARVAQLGHPMIQGILAGCVELKARDA